MTKLGIIIIATVVATTGCARRFGSYEGDTPLVVANRTEHKLCKFHLQAPGGKRDTVRKIRTRRPS